ncbi:MAG TPA: hypothetical protein VNV63_06200 [Nitrospiria bacterium]|jgi:hypothetical protein|nr:hypothetical protein [Nitrospiria bacterium]
MSNLDDTQFCPQCEAHAKERDRLQEEVERLKKMPPGIVQQARTCGHTKNNWTCLECYWELQSRAERAEKMARELAEAIRNHFKKCDATAEDSKLEEALAAFEAKEGGK